MRKHISKEVHYINRILRNCDKYNQKSCLPKTFSEWLKKYLFRIKGVDVGDSQLVKVNLIQNGKRLSYEFVENGETKEGDVTVRKFKCFCRTHRFSYRVIVSDLDLDITMHKHLKTKIGDCIVYDAGKSKGIIIIGSYDYGDGEYTFAARALFGEAIHTIEAINGESYTRSLIYSNFAPSMSTMRFATESEIRKLLNKKEGREFFDFYVERFDYLEKYRKYIQ